GQAGVTLQGLTVTAGRPGVVTVVASVGRGRGREISPPIRGGVAAHVRRSVGGADTAVHVPVGPAVVVELPARDGGRGVLVAVDRDGNLRGAGVRRRGVEVAALGLGGEREQHECRQ